MHPRNELGIRKSWQGFAATQIMSYYCEDEDITDPGKIALKTLRGVGNEGLKRLNSSGMSDADRRGPTRYGSCFESRPKTNLNIRVHRLHLMDYRQRSEDCVDGFVTTARTRLKPWNVREWITLLCWSSVQCCFTSTETIRLIRDGQTVYLSTCWYVYLSLYSVEFEWPKRQIFILCIYYEW